MHQPHSPLPGSHPCDVQILGPIIFGVGAATYKAASGTLRFDGMMNVLLSLVLIVMPLTWWVWAM